MPRVSILGIHPVPDCVPSILSCMETPRDFGYAFGKLETAVEALVGEGAIRGRLFTTRRHFVITQAEDFPEHLRAEHSQLFQEITPNPHDLRPKQAGALAEKLFSFYTNVAEAYYRRLG
jgi:hypothetical protein